MKPAHDYVAEYRLGTKAPNWARCPYSVLEIGRRCAWMAGYWDARNGWQE